MVIVHISNMQEIAQVILKIVNIDNKEMMRLLIIRLMVFNGDRKVIVY